MNHYSEGLLEAMAKDPHQTRKIRTERSQCQVKQIDVLPDGVLLDVFDFYLNTFYPPYFEREDVEAWQTLVHVCRRWRSLVLGSPRLLNLRLVCTPETPARDTLNIWPALPLVVSGMMSPTSRTDDIIAALGQNNRVCQIHLGAMGWQLEEVLASMRVPFPELTDLGLSSYDETPPLIPDSLLDGSAPSLQCFTLHGIPFPGLPNLLLSANRLVQLILFNIPHSWYISPEAIVTSLSVLSSLETLTLQFQSPQSPPGWQSRSLPPLKRSILRALRHFHFVGVAEYLDDLVTFIDAPQLKVLNTTFLNQIDLGCPRLAQFINCTPKLRARDEAHVQFYDSSVSIKLRHRASESDFDDIRIFIPCREPDLQLSSTEKVCNSSLHPLSTVEDLYIEYDYSLQVWKDDTIENILWFQLLLPYTTVKNLYLNKEFAPGIVAALHEPVGSRITEVLPSLQNIFVEGLEPLGPFQENLGRFVTTRQLSGHPVAISIWNGSRTRKRNNAKLT